MSVRRHLASADRSPPPPIEVPTDHAPAHEADAAVDDLVDPPAGIAHAALPAGRSAEHSSQPTIRSIDWSSWLRLLDRKRRLYARHQPLRPRPWPRPFVDRLTVISFRLEGIQLAPSQVAAARAPKSEFRSRLAQRVRSHLAILHHIHSSLVVGEPLNPSAVLRWYTRISAGLSTTMPACEKLDRIDRVVRRINSPQLRLQPAIQELASLHVELLADPLVPGFNGILARLLLCYHLGRCGLPPALLNPAMDQLQTVSPLAAVDRLLRAIDTSYDLLLAAPSLPR